MQEAIRRRVCRRNTQSEVCVPVRVSNASGGFAPLDAAETLFNA
jgi:hypothetical protein